MKQSIKDGELLLVPLPEKSSRIKIQDLTIGDADVQWLHYFTIENPWGEIKLPPGNYEYVGVWPGLTEEQARICLDVIRDSVYKDCPAHITHYEFDHYPPLESFNSRMESLRVTGKVAVLKSITDLK